MINQKRIKLLILSLIVTFLIIGLALIPSIPQLINIVMGCPQPYPNIDKIIVTTGDKELISTTKETPKTKGTKEFAKCNYIEAANQFKQSLQQQKNDPEALIYLNNALINKNESYTIAVIAPVSDKPDKSAEILRGVAHAQNKINNSVEKINGKYLKILIVDENDKKDKAKTAAELLAKTPEVLGVIGHYSSGVTLVAGETYKNNLVAISPTSTSVELDKFSDYVLRTSPSDRIAGGALADYAINTLKKHKAIIFYDQESDYSKSLKKEFSTKFEDKNSGGKVIEKYNLQDQNFENINYIQSRIKDKNPEIIMLAPGANETILKKARQIVIANENKLPILAGDAFYSNETLNQTGKNLVGTVMAIPWHIKAHINEQFIADAKELWGADISGRTATSYDATQAFIAALKANPTPTRENVQQTLKNLTFEATGATSKISFAKEGDRKQPVQLVQVIKSPNSGYEFSPIP